MRLIQTTGKDPKLVYFASEAQIPEYAILSHVWEEEEVTFQHMQDPSKRKGMKGWSKIVRACEVARSEDWEYIWIDTCCINKSSSSELSEAINSMYRYYTEAVVCYAYLADVRSDLPKRTLNLVFRASKWFMRGWTLQELIAPTTVVLFAQNWEKIGTKASLQDILTEITGIPSRDLLRFDPRLTSVAARMSWAAGRKTTRIEDRAYSLMGIFGVFMPPIYGEGEHAFIRLQEEILKVSDDHTIFAWKSRSSSCRAILATSPDMFEGSGKYQRLDGDLDNRRPFSLTNIGLLVYLPLIPLRHIDRPEFLALLNCGAGTSRHLAIHVKKSDGWDGHQYERVQSDMLEDEATILAKCGKIEGSLQELLFKAWDLPPVKHNDFQSDEISVFFPGRQGIRPVRVKIGYFNAYSIAAVKSTDTADYNLGVFTLDYLPSTFLFIHDPSHRLFVVVVGMRSDRFWLDLVLDFKMDKHNLKDIQQSYENGKECADMRQKNFDRISKFLTDDVAILIEARRQNQNKVDRPSYIVNIRIVDKIYLDLPIPTCQYTFIVSFSGTINAGFSLLEAHPDSCWEALGSDTMNLFLDDGSLSGTLCFQQKQNRKRFAVTLGFRDKTAWSDVHFLRDTEYEETAKDICKRIGGGGYSSTLDLLWPEEPSPAGDWVLTAKVSSHVLGKSDNQYKSEIEVSKWWENPETSTVEDLPSIYEEFCNIDYIQRME